MVVEHAERILAWHEHRPPDEIPPRWMWHLDHETSAWFERIDDKDKAADPDDELVDNEALPPHLRRAKR